ncbi:GNAT family N-acetyltransferase [Streptomyces sp. NPDC048357]|uniref:GNAT family N-acetyltransferase n=1 Tax=Streptomyces sp. NPDC048357 TaxID=3154719 RepID=UPI0034323639
MVHVREMDAADIEAVSTIRVRGRLLDEAHSRMEGQGFETSALWVLHDNQRARRFYERAGYRADGATQDDVYDEVTLTELRYRRGL